MSPSYLPDLPVEITMAYSSRKSNDFYSTFSNAADIEFSFRDLVGDPYPVGGPRVFKLWWLVMSFNLSSSLSLNEGNRS